MNEDTFGRTDGSNRQNSGRHLWTKIEDVGAATRERLTSRRSVLSSVGAGAGALAFAGSASGRTATQEDGNDGGDSSGDGGSGGSDDPGPVDVLNYALTLEHLENNLYQQGMEEYGDACFTNADVVQANTCESEAEEIPGYVAEVQAHEQAHVDVLTQTIEKPGGDPVSEASYDFGYSSPSEFLELGSVLENTGVAAYAGAAPLFDDENDNLLAAAASIHSVEARHAGILNDVVGKSPFPNAFDEPKSMSEVEEAIQPFLKAESVGLASPRGRLRTPPPAPAPATDRAPGAARSNPPGPYTFP